MNSIKSVLSNIKNGQIDKIYFLKGDDQFLQNFFMKHFSKISFQIQKDLKDFCQHNEFSGKEIIDIILSIDLFNTKKLFILKDPAKNKR